MGGEEEQEISVIDSGGWLWILKGGENYKSEQRLLGIDQLNYEYSSEFAHFFVTSFEDTQIDSL